VTAVIWQSGVRLLLASDAAICAPTSRNRFRVMNKIDFAVGIGGENGQGIASTGNILALILRGADCISTPTTLTSRLSVRSHFLTIRESGWARAFHG